MLMRRHGSAVAGDGRASRSHARSVSLHRSYPTTSPTLPSPHLPCLSLQDCSGVWLLKAPTCAPPHTMDIQTLKCVKHLASPGAKSPGPKMEVHYIID